jgi:hypothetical protein
LLVARPPRRSQQFGSLAAQDLRVAVLEWRRPIARYDAVMADVIAEFHRAAARRQRRISGIAGVVMLALGAAIVALALWLGDAGVKVGAKWGSVIGGAVLAFCGVRSLVRFVRNQTR